MTDESDSGDSTALQSVVRGAGAQAVGLGATRVLAFIATYLLTRSLGPNLYGIYSLGKSITSITATVTNLGTDQSIIRFVPQYEDPINQNRVFGLATLTSFLGSVVFGTCLFFLAPLLTRVTLNQPLLTDVIRLFALTLPFNTLTGCISSVFRSFELPGYQVLTESIARQVFRVITLGIVVAIGATLISAVAAAVVAWILAFIFGVGLIARRLDIRPGIRGNEPTTFEFYNFSVPLTLSNVGTILQNQVDLLMVGIFLSGSAVGIYNLSTVLSQALLIPAIGFNTIFPPIAARMYGNDEMKELEALYTRVTRWSFTLSLLPSIGLFIYSTETLSIFGQGFAAGNMVLSLFILARLINAAAGSSGYTLMMTGHQYLVMINEWIIGLGNIVLNYIFITRFGLIGAALATALTLISINIVRTVEVWYTEGLLPYSWKYLKPILAGVFSGAAMVGWQSIAPVEGLLFLIAGAFVGTSSFLIALIFLGIESEDKKFFRETVLNR